MGPMIRDMSLVIKLIMQSGSLLFRNILSFGLALLLDRARKCAHVDYLSGSFRSMKVVFYMIDFAIKKFNSKVCFPSIFHSRVVILNIYFLSTEQLHSSENWPNINNHCS
jgi:ABC-type sugar transport system permease subunit